MNTVTIAAKGAGEKLYFGGGLMTLRITAEQSGGPLLLIEDRAPRGKTTPLHVHDSFDETFYVIEGELLLHVDGEEFVAGPETVATIPRGLPHAFLVVSDEARFLTFITPGVAAEPFYREGGAPVVDESAPIPPLDIARVLKAGEVTGGMRVLGPPPFELAATTQ